MDSVPVKRGVLMMKIDRIEIGEVAIPLRMPFQTASRTVDAVHNILIRIVTDDGTAGYGEAPPTALITGETKASIREAIMQYIAPSIIGMEIFDLDTIMQKMHASIVNNTSAKAAVDMALYDLYAKKLGQPLYKVLGGAKRKIETAHTISDKPIDEMVRDSLQAVQDGFSILNVAVGRNGIKDVESLLAIRKAVGPDIRIRVEANQSWKPQEAVRIINMMEDKGVQAELVEQPVKAHDLAGLKFVTQHVQTPIVADESIFSVKDALQIIQTQSADLINIKLMKTGGIHEALKICTVAETYGVDCMIGCMLESKISVSAAAHLAAAKNCITMVDLIGPSFYKIEAYEGGPLFTGGTIKLGDANGIGINAFPKAHFKKLGIVK
jgi:o-succinylbenzoate synthase